MIALLTDFGTGDGFAGVVKGVIKSISPSADIIDITHDVEPFSVTNAQFHLYSSYRWFPGGTVFFTVVDPGVGTGRRGIIADTGKYIFVAPDNGILTPVLDEASRFYRIDTGLFPGASPTFHGRDIFAPVAAGLSAGRSPLDYGTPCDKIVEKKFPVFIISSGYADCSVLHIDRFGNIILSVPGSRLDLSGFSKIEVRFNGTGFPVRQVKTFGELENGVPGIYTGSSGFLEICMNMGSLSAIKNIRIDERMRILYE